MSRRSSASVLSVLANHHDSACIESRDHDIMNIDIISHQEKTEKNETQLETVKEIKAFFSSLSLDTYKKIYRTACGKPINVKDETSIEALLLKIREFGVSSLLVRLTQHRISSIQTQLNTAQDTHDDIVQKIVSIGIVQYLTNFCSQSLLAAFATSIGLESVITTSHNLALSIYDEIMMIGTEQILLCCENSILVEISNHLHLLPSSISKQLIDKLLNFQLVDVILDHIFNLISFSEYAVSSAENSGLPMDLFAIDSSTFSKSVPLDETSESMETKSNSHASTKGYTKTSSSYKNDNRNNGKNTISSTTDSMDIDENNKKKYKESKSASVDESDEATQTNQSKKRKRPSVTSVVLESDDESDDSKTLTKAGNHSNQNTPNKKPMLAESADSSNLKSAFSPASLEMPESTVDESSKANVKAKKTYFGSKQEAVTPKSSEKISTKTGIKAAETTPPSTPPPLPSSNKSKASATTSSVTPDIETNLAPKRRGRPPNSVRFGLSSPAKVDSPVNDKLQSSPSSQTNSEVAKEKSKELSPHRNGKSSSQSKQSKSPIENDKQKSQNYDEEQEEDEDEDKDEDSDIEDDEEESEEESEEDEEDDEDDEDDEGSDTNRSKSDRPARHGSSNRSPGSGKGRAKYQAPPLTNIRKGITGPQLHNLYNMTDLQEWCKLKGVDHTGKKSAVIKRILYELDPANVKPPPPHKKAKRFSSK